MKNNLLFILFICISTSLLSQKRYVKTYYSDNILMEEGWKQNENKIAFWTFYHKNGNIKKQGHFNNNQATKYWYFYRKDGTIEKEGHFLNGKQNNWWIFYDRNGEIKKKCQLKDNIKDGYCLLYQKQKLVKALQFSNNKQVKEWTDFSSFKRDNDLNALK